MVKNKSLVLATLVLIVFTCTCTVWAAGYQPLRIEPSLLTFTGKAGETFTGAITVTNKGTEAVDPKAVLSDWTLDAYNQLVVQDAGTLNSSFNGWIKFNPRQFHLLPGATQTVRFTIKIPQNAQPGEKRGMIAFEQIIPYDGDIAGTTARVQVTTTIYVSVLPVNRSIDITGLSIIPNKETNQSTLVMQIKGTGNASFCGTGSFTVLPERDDNALVSGTTEQLVVMPDVATAFAGRFDAVLAPGKYRLEVKITSTQAGAAPLERVYSFEVK